MYAESLIRNEAREYQGIKGKARKKQTQTRDGPSMHGVEYYSKHAIDQITNTSIRLGSQLVRDGTRSQQSRLESGVIKMPSLQE